ncbi:GNAT family N-acetyltransferase [Mesorhizobium sp. BAC0120]|uniref:GNAT family N-acetyltransferase n=1 Tax=Mesorhizobium sp. BAC0120 TaxID=3090670 RepID=UPI00298D0ECC|nr:GNAT family N-acetyltransferase [Mesorhizobium sp. BAC0120]MDW6025497.1 GNAT family N-acetyltransferase [Mesorhizobium sp. BAC0120]
MSLEIPIIETERLILRDHRYSDFEAYVMMWADPVVTRFIGGRPRTRDETWIRFLRHAGMWHHLGFGFWAIEEKASRRLIGEGGFHELKRNMQPSLEGTLETGWSLLPEAHGKGYGTEAVGAMLRWGAANYPGSPITCFIDPENNASIRVARKNGFVERTRAEFGGEPVIIFDHRP